MAIVAGFIVACGSSGSDPADARYDAANQAGHDATIEPAIDAGIDARIDVVIDAGTDAGAGVALVCSDCHTAATLSAAHAVHINGGSDSAAIPCSECHPLFTSSSHITGPVIVAFATEPGDIAALGGLSPTWSAQTKTCASVYCHGGGTTVTGGSVTTPNWTITDGSQEQCDSCHGDPPVANSHLQSTKDFCNVCHEDALQGGRIDSRRIGLHVDGVTDVMLTTEWGTHDHGLSVAPPGHPVNNDYSSCVICHGPTPPGLPNVKQETMTCTTCHE